MLDVLLSKGLPCFFLIQVMSKERVINCGEWGGEGAGLHNRRGDKSSVTPTRKGVGWWIRVYTL